MHSKSLPYVSVVICIYNGVKFLKDAIDSLLDQNYPKDMYEIILVDDGSTDGSSNICLNILKETENKLPVIIYVQQKNSGLSAARNTGVKNSKGQIIAFIDQDAVATEDWITDITNKFTTSQLPQIIGGQVLLLNKNSKFASLLFDSMFSYYMTDKHSVIGTNMAFSRVLLNENNPFHPAFVSRADETYIFQKLNQKVKPEQIPSATVYHETPASLKTWLKTRYENGYFDALLVIINDKHIYEKNFLFLRIFNKIFFLVLPIIILLSLIMRLDVLLYTGIFSYLFISSRRYLVTGYIKKLISHFWHTSKAKLLAKLCLVPVILLLVILGYFYEDFGYIIKMISHLNTNDHYKSENIKETTILNILCNVKCL